MVLGALAASPYTLLKSLSAGGAGGVVWEIWAALGLGVLSQVDDDPDGKSLGIRSRVAMLRYMWDASELKYTI